MVDQYDQALAEIKDFLDATQQTMQDQILGFKNKKYLADIADLKLKCTDFNQWKDETIRRSLDIDNQIVMLNTRISTR